MDKWYSGFFWAIWIMGLILVILGNLFNTPINLTLVLGFLLMVISLTFIIIIYEIEEIKEKVFGLSKRKKPRKKPIAFSGPKYPKKRKR